MCMDPRCVRERMVKMLLQNGALDWPSVEIMSKATVLGAYVLQASPAAPETPRKTLQAA